MTAPAARLDPPVVAPDSLDLSPFTTASRLLVALDFDGVIAPLQDDPGASRPLPASARAVEALAHLPRTVVGYISGRSMEVLKHLSSAPAAALFIGSHGLETDFTALESDRSTPDTDHSTPEVDRSTPESGSRTPGDTASTAGHDWSTPLTPAEAALLDELDAGLASIRSATPPAGHGELRIEPKPLGRTAHTRGSSTDREAYFRTELDALAARLPALRNFAGHAMTEFAVRMETKGDGLARMIAATNPDAVVYLGDDTTDEDAFAHLAERTDLASLAIKVGDQDTRAPHRIADPEAVSALLGRLARERDRDLGER